MYIYEHRAKRLGGGVGKKIVLINRSPTLDRTSFIPCTQSSTLPSMLRSLTLNGIGSAPDRRAAARRGNQGTNEAVQIVNRRALACPALHPDACPARSTAPARGDELGAGASRPMGPGAGPGSAGHPSLWATSAGPAASAGASDHDSAASAEAGGALLESLTGTRWIPRVSGGGFKAAL
jgi:hypothetical protein